MLLELGKGFAFVGVDQKDYYIDLLFYNFNLHCFCIFELKATDFKPEYTGKLNFYLNAIDQQLRKPTDNPSIGIILCKTKSKLTVEYALQDINKPMGVAEYTTKLMEKLPKKLESSLPTIEDIELELLAHKKKSQSTAKKKKKK